MKLLSNKTGNSLGILSLQLHEGQEQTVSSDHLLLHFESPNSEGLSKYTIGVECVLESSNDDSIEVQHTLNLDLPEVNGTLNNDFSISPSNSSLIQKNCRQVARDNQ